MNTELFCLLIFTAVLLIGPLLSLLRGKSYGLYQGIIDDTFLAYFEIGKEYTALEIIQRVDRETGGAIRLNQKDVEEWLKQCVSSKKIEMLRVMRPIKQGSHRTFVYSLPKTAP